MTTPHPQAPLRMYWWRPWSPLRGNFGDELGPYLVDALFGIRTVWAEPDTCEIAAAGSIIEILLSSKSTNRPVLWGSGMFWDSSGVVAADEFEITALRGCLTRARITDLDTEVALGDPGLLAHALLKSAPRKQYSLGIVPHFLDADRPAVTQLRTWPDVKIIDVTDPAPEVVREIAECHYILSSSLHGLVVADSVGTPNAYVAFSNDHRIGGPNKFHDYYSVFADPGRQLSVPLAGVLSGDTRSVAAEVERGYRAPDDLTTITDRLVKAFPR
ncbi:polysaccharide pyruvyl transferase family protein [Kribbella solani]|uniref:polysaccharide pyruvyl transferase family protein n=1 Tax=Kribbella solani TaxID=236067 RepID=UPI0029A639DF|nr:polysaccharide pyruvyl transferase family protein [Kribbella solani]MDX2973430.1 polysaccharide pyruvyl transferase family protein [Kribbella solani]